MFVTDGEGVLLKEGTSVAAFTSAMNSSIPGRLVGGELHPIWNHLFVGQHHAYGKHKSLIPAREPNIPYYNNALTKYWHVDKPPGWHLCKYTCHLPCLGVLMMLHFIHQDIGTVLPWLHLREVPHQLLLSLPVQERLPENGVLPTPPSKLHFTRTKVAIGITQTLGLPTPSGSILISPIVQAQLIR